MDSPRQDSEPGSRQVLERVGLQLVPVSPLIGPLLYASSSGLQNKPHALRIGDQQHHMLDVVAGRVSRA